MVETKLTTVKILKNVYSKFKSLSFDSDITLQKLVNRSMDLYLKDKKYKKLITEHEELVKSGSNLQELEMVQNKLLQASIDKYKAEISEALAILEVYFQKPVAIGEHPDLLTEIDKYIEKLEAATGKLETLQRYFDEHADVDTNKKLLKG